MSNPNLRAALAAALASKSFTDAAKHVEEIALDVLRGAADAVIPAPIEPIADAVMSSAEKGIADATADGLAGRSADIVPDLIRDGEAALVDLENSITSAISEVLPGAAGVLVAPIVKAAMGVVESKLTAAGAPALSAAAGARAKAAASVSPTAAAMALARVG